MIFFRPKGNNNEGVTSAVIKSVQNLESDDDEDAAAEVDVDFVEDSYVETGLKTSSSMDLVGSAATPGSGKSPTHSMRSVLSRPRSAPQRRATISGSSPSHYKPYINITEVSYRMN